MSPLEQMRERAEKINNTLGNYQAISGPTKTIQNAMLILSQDIERLIRAVEILHKEVKTINEYYCCTYQPEECQWCDLTINHICPECSIQKSTTNTLKQANKILEGI
jgi:hypothetical protein